MAVASELSRPLVAAAFVAFVGGVAAVVVTR